METYLTIEELAKHLKLAEQTIRRWVLNREIPFHKIKKVIRFRLSEIEKWIDGGAGAYIANELPGWEHGEPDSGLFLETAGCENPEACSSEICCSEVRENLSGD